MEATQGSPRYAPDGRGGDGPPQWRWLAMVLAVAVHGPIVLLLSSSGEGEGRRPREELERMRISWSERPRPAEPVPQADAPPTSTAARVPARIEAPHMPAADGELRGIPFVADDDLQAPAPAGAPEHGFRRDSVPRPGSTRRHLVTSRSCGCATPHWPVAGTNRHGGSTAANWRLPCARALRPW